VQYHYFKVSIHNPSLNPDYYYETIDPERGNPSGEVSLFDLPGLNDLSDHLQTIKFKGIHCNGKKLVKFVKSRDVNNQALTSQTIKLLTYRRL